MHKRCFVVLYVMSKDLLVLHGTSCSGEHMSLRIIEYKTSRAGIEVRAMGVFIVGGKYSCQFLAKFSS